MPSGAPRSVGYVPASSKLLADPQNDPMSYGFPNEPTVDQLSINDVSDVC